MRYTEMLDTIHGLLFKRLDERILTRILQKLQADGEVSLQDNGIYVQFPVT